MRGQWTTNDGSGGGAPRPRTRRPWDEGKGTVGTGHTGRPQSLSVLMVIESYLPWTGGTERQLAALAAELGARNVRVEVLTEQGQPEWPLREAIDGPCRH